MSNLRGQFEFFADAKEAEDNAKTIEEKVAVVHAKIMEITQGRTTEAQKKLDEVTKLWETTRSRITQLQVAIKTSERLVSSFIPIEID